MKPYDWAEEVDSNYDRWERNRMRFWQDVEEETAVSRLVGNPEAFTEHIHVWYRMGDGTWQCDCGANEPIDRGPRTAIWKGSIQDYLAHQAEIHHEVAQQFANNEEQEEPNP